MTQTRTIEAEVAFDALGEVYDASFRREIDLAENAAIFELLRKHIRYLGDKSVGDRCVLDLGCGTGLFLEYVDLRPACFLGIDISAAMLEQARAKFPEHCFEKGRMENIQAPAESFDLVASLFGSLSYCEYPPLAVAEMFRVLRPGGKVFVMGFGPRYESTRQDITAAHGFRVPKRCWTNREFQDLFQGFRMLDSFGFSCCQEKMSPNPNASLSHQLVLEADTLGRVWPDRCFFQVYVGEKDATAL
ncbi:methyltransferase domain-containing protein [bacterium]|nr:methyltransferase domain-containing protein [bacterium]